MQMSVRELLQLVNHQCCRCCRNPRRGDIVKGNMLFGAPEGDLAKGFIDLDQASISSALDLRNKAGEQVTPDTPPVWTLGNPTVASVAVAADGMSAVFTPLAVGTTSVNVTLDAELGEGVREMVLSGELEVTPGDIATGEVTFGSPVDA